MGVLFWAPPYLRDTMNLGPCLDAQIFGNAHTVSDT